MFEQANERDRARASVYTYLTEIYGALSLNLFRFILEAPLWKVTWIYMKI